MTWKRAYGFIRQTPNCKALRGSMGSTNVLHCQEAPWGSESGRGAFGNGKGASTNRRVGTF